MSQLGLFDDVAASAAESVDDVRRAILADRRTAADVDGLCSLMELFRGADSPVGSAELVKRSRLDRLTLMRRLESLLMLSLIEIVPGDDEAVGYVVRDGGLR